MEREFLYNPIARAMTDTYYEQLTDKQKDIFINKLKSYDFEGDADVLAYLIKTTNGEEQC